ncbi:MAG: hypothetical protein ACI39H_06100 [Lachnospiraceae bacterium]
MKVYDLLNGKDKRKIIYMWLFTILCCLLTTVYGSAEYDNLPVAVCLSLVFFAVFFLMVTNDYVLEEKEKYVHQMLQRTCWIYCWNMFLCTLGSLLPFPVHFVLSASVLLGMILPVHYSMILSLLISVVISLNSADSYYELAYFVFLCLMGGMFSGIISRKKIRLQTSVMLFAIYISIYFIFHYMSGNEPSEKTLFAGCLEGILNLFLILVLVPVCERKEEQIEVAEYGFALEKEFPLMVLVKSFPEERYKHCRISANLCHLCAKEAGLDVNLCCCAGFYYSLCDNDEENPVFSAVKLAKQNGLPIQAVRILNQYRGRSQSILTKEAALVDLVDETLCELERVTCGDNQDVIQREMLVIKVFNDLSVSGRYDDSGLGINSFLKIRDCILHEVRLNDSEYFE